MDKFNLRLLVGGRFIKTFSKFNITFFITLFNLYMKKSYLKIYGNAIYDIFFLNYSYMHSIMNCKYYIYYF